MKIKKPHCNFCEKDLLYVRVDGFETGEPEIADVTFDIILDKTGAHANPTSLCSEKFKHTSNPLRLAAFVESWVEETAEEVRCPLCTKAVKLVRIKPQPAPQQGMQPANPMAQLLQQIQQQVATPPTFGPMSPNLGQNKAAIIALFDSKFTDSELTDFLTDVGATPPPGAAKPDLLATLEDFLYN